MLEEEYDQMLKEKHHDKKRTDYTGPASPRPVLRPESQKDELESATTVLPTDGNKKQSTFAK